MNGRCEAGVSCTIVIHDSATIANTTPAAVSCARRRRSDPGAQTR